MGVRYDSRTGREAHGQGVPLRACPLPTALWERRNVCHDNDQMSMDKVIDSIVDYNERIRETWSSVHGWAPTDAADLLAKSRLDRTVSLSHCLRLWFLDSSEEDAEGRLILAWANLGALVEGTMKWILSVFENDYSNDPVTHKGKAISPDRLRLEDLRQFFKKKTPLWGRDGNGWDEWIIYIQKRRNAIHAYRDRDIGDFNEFFGAVRRYMSLIEKLDRAPWPQDYY